MSSPLLVLTVMRVCANMQVIGDVGLDKCAVARHQHSARARDHVTVVKLTEESFLKAVLQQAQSAGPDEYAGAEGGGIITTRVRDVGGDCNLDNTVPSV